jgi:hypothetical protein
VGPPYPGLSGSEDDIREAVQNLEDPNLRSVDAITGYYIEATDGEIGHVEDFLLQDDNWSIHYLVVDTKNWWPGKKVLISPQSVRGIDWAAELVSLNANRQQVKGSPTYDGSTTVDQAYENNFHNYYAGSRHSDRP